MGRRVARFKMSCSKSIDILRDPGTSNQVVFGFGFVGKKI